MIAEQMEDALRIALDLRAKATSIDGWCSCCYQIDHHLDRCQWTRLIALLETEKKQS